MKTAKPKVKSVLELVDRINVLNKEIKERQDELEQLTSLQFQEPTSEPDGFEYKDAIMELFSQKPDAFLGIDDVMGYIQSKYNFSPNRDTISLRVGYLIDNAMKLERVIGKRGQYRLAKIKPVEIPVDSGGS